MLKRIALLLIGFFAMSVVYAETNSKTTPTSWEAGKNYFVLDEPQATSTGKDVEVLEIFSYSCPHCAHFEPYAAQIKQGLPAYAHYKYMPAIFNPAWEITARAYYTAELLGVLDKTHQALFDALHRDHRTMQTVEDFAAFYAQYGVDQKNFNSTASSFVVEGKLAQSREMVPKYKVEGTPTLIVNGKYRVTAEGAGGYPQMIELVNWLVKKEHDAKSSVK